MLFMREFPYFLGGHLKVFDYLGHIAASGRYAPRLYMVPGSLDPSPYVPPRTVCTTRVEAADAYFVGGMNWKMLDAVGVATAGSPTICLVQGFQHLEPRSAHYAYLERAALRICVSTAVADAVRDSGRANGPIVAIPNGIDLAMLGGFAAPKRGATVFIAGMKEPALATEIAGLLEARGVEVDLAIDPVGRAQFLGRMSACAVTIGLPLAIDGFYLPGLEAMALGSALVVTDAIGPRSFCVDERNCIIAGADAASYAEAARLLLADSGIAGRLREAGYRTAREHSLETERAAFHRALAEFDRGFGR